MRDNTAPSGGGGILAISSFLTIERCRVLNNDGGYGRGGGVHVAGPGSTSISGSLFEGNVVRSGLAGGHGAGIYQDFETGPLTVSGSTFFRNVGRTTVGLHNDSSGGGIFSGSKLTLTRSRFVANSASNGAGLLTWNPDVLVDGCEFLRNSAVGWSTGTETYGGYGAGYVSAGGGIVRNSSFVLNSATNDGGAVTASIDTVANPDARLLVHNSVLWGNTASDPGFVRRAQVNGASWQLRYCIVQGLLQQLPGEDPPIPASFPGSLDVDPQIVNPAGADGLAATLDDNARLAVNSPGIDGGSNSLITPDTLLDLDGHARRIDLPSAPDTGEGAAPIVDMGAYEFEPADASALFRDGFEAP